LSSRLRNVDPNKHRGRLKYIIKKTWTIRQDTINAILQI